MGRVRDLISNLAEVKTGQTLSPFRADEQQHGSFIAQPERSSSSEKLKANDNEFIPSDNMEILAQQIAGCLREIGELQVERTDTEALRVEESNVIERRRQREDNAFNEREAELIRNLGTARDVWTQRFEALFDGFDPRTMMPIATQQPTGVEKMEAQQEPPAIPPQEPDPEPVVIEKI